MLAWKKTIEDTFGYEPKYLVAAAGEEVRGVLPLFVVENVLLGRVLISSPFAVYGGTLADSPETYGRFRHEIERLGSALRVRYVELRNAHAEQCLGFHRVERYVTFIQAIGTDEAAILNSIPRKTRAAIRRSLKQEFTVRQTGDFNTFERLYSENLRRLGTPSFPPSFFGRLLANFRNEADVREIVLGGKPVAAVLTFYFRDHVLPYYGASDPAYNAAAPNNFMYFDLMRNAGLRGYATFDFGRSKRNCSGSYDFKSHWGMVERPLPYEMLLVRSRSLPNYTPANPVFDLPRTIWRHLPLALTRRLGPSLVRLVP